MSRIRIVHVISGLSTGGAENALYRLLEQLDRIQFECFVVSLRGTGTVGPKISALGIPVLDLGVRSLPRAAIVLRELVRYCASVPAQILQGWLYHGNLAVSMAAHWIRPRPAVIWNIRGSLHDMASFKWTTRLTIRAGAALSGGPSAVIFNSHVGAVQHRKFGYRNRREVLIPNGFDSTAFARSLSARQKIRSQLGIGEAQPVVGCVGRFHPAKGSDVFLGMAMAVARERPDAHFLCIGRGMEWGNSAIRRFEGLSQLGGRCHLLGERHDVSQLLSAMDVFVNPSRTEGFPNALAEAMLAELPCTATDVGDSARLLDGCGSLVNPDDVDGVCQSVLRWLSKQPEERMAAGRAARQRIKSNYSITKSTLAYSDLYSDVVSASMTS